LLRNHCGKTEIDEDYLLVCFAKHHVGGLDVLVYNLILMQECKVFIELVRVEVVLVSLLADLHCKLGTFLVHDQIKAQALGDKRPDFQG